MADDGIKLTDAEKAQLNCDCVKYDGSHYDTCFVPAVESIVAARVQALADDVDERVGAASKVLESAVIEARSDRDAARAELAAANTRADAAEAELEQAWETVKAGYADLGDSTERLTAIIDRLVRERNQERFARAALSARLERVQALADEWDRNVKAMLRGGGGILSATVRDVEQRLRAALGEDA